MKYAQASLGRVFVLRLEDGDHLPDCLESFAAEHGLSQAFCALVGGVASGQIVVGPKDGQALPVTPMLHTLAGVHEAAAVGTIFPDEAGVPRLHMHAALGREGQTRAGCVRTGLDIWKIGEVIILELTGARLVRRRDPATGFELLAVED
jgi:predicted DNA-binding protein with PD1-like motif